MTSNRPPDRGNDPNEPRLDPLLEVREKRIAATRLRHTL